MDSSSDGFLLVVYTPFYVWLWPPLPTGLPLSAAKHSDFLFNLLLGPSFMIFKSRWFCFPRQFFKVRDQIF